MILSNEKHQLLLKSDSADLAMLLPYDSLCMQASPILLLQRKFFFPPYGGKLGRTTSAKVSEQANKPAELSATCMGGSADPGTST
jgi:hypothetical protein